MRSNTLTRVSNNPGAVHRHENGHPPNPLLLGTSSYRGHSVGFLRTHRTDKRGRTPTLPFKGVDAMRCPGA